MPEEGINLPDLIGRSESNVLVQEFIRRYGLVDYDQTEEAKRAYEERYPDQSFDALNVDILKTLGRFSVSYVLDPINWIVDLHVEARQMGGVLSVTDVSVRPGYEGKLPYGLAFDTDVSSFAVGRVLEKNRQINEGIVSHSRAFFFDNLSIAIVFEEPSNCLTFLRIEAIAPADLARLRFHDGLEAQKANLVESVEGCLESWQKTNPVRRWRQRMADGDTSFNSTNLDLADAEINAFFASIRQAVKKQSPSQIINALKKTVKNLNRLNRNHGCFIETGEREELALFLQDVLRATGLQFEEGFDVTQEWRDW